MHRSSIRKVWLCILACSTNLDVIDAAVKTALVLQGGGAKGAFQAGVIQHICETSFADTWTLLTGTSIGALNAAFLAQYAPEAQCKQAVPALIAEWKAIKSVSDLMVRSGTKEPCGLQTSALSTYATGFYLLQDLDRQNAGGFTCDMTPALERYKRILDPEKIIASGMELGAPAVSLETGLVRYFNETTKPDVLFEGIVASGTLTPIVPPVLVENQRYMDGGVRANLPILHALSRGADRIIALLLNPLDLSRPATFPGPKEANQMKARLLFLLDVFYDAEFMDDMREACYRYPHAEIIAYVPQKPIGSLLDFTEPSIAQFLQDGRSETRRVPDFCVELGFERGPSPPWFYVSLGMAIMAGIGAAWRFLETTYYFCRQRTMRSFKSKTDEDDVELASQKGRSLE